MTTVTITRELKLSIIKALAAGDTVDQVATTQGLTTSDVIAIAKNHGYPDRDKLTWAADIMTVNIGANPDPVHPPQIPIAPPREASRPAPSATAQVAVVRPPAVTQADTISNLINTAKAHPSKRIQTAGDRLLDQIGRLRDLIAEDTEKNAERRKLEAAKAAARAEVERLEQQLDAARAKLRGTPMPAKPKATAPDETQPELPCRNDGCDRTFPTPQGRSMHERMKCEHREQAAS